MNKIFVIACEEHTGYELDSVKPVFTTIVLNHYGFWESKADAQERCSILNVGYIPEDDSEAGEPYFVLGIDKAND